MPSHSSDGINTGNLTQPLAAQATDLEDLVANPKGKAARQVAAAQADWAFRDACPFTPDTSAGRALPRGVDPGGAIVPFAPAATADRLAERTRARRTKLLVSVRCTSASSSDTSPVAALVVCASVHAL